jgi:type IV pilus assembly protein PilM
MFMMPKRALIGLDIGSKAIKAVEVTEDKPGTFQISGFTMHELRQGEPLKEALTRAVHMGKFKTRRVATALSGKSVIVRYITMPRVSEIELKNLLPTEASKYIPFEVEDSILDGQIMDPETTGEKEMKVLLVAVKRSFVMDHVRLLEEAGLVSAFIDVDSFALGNAYELRNTADGRSLPPDQIAALIDIGATKTSINIMRGASSCFAREIFSAGNDFTEQLTKKMSLDTQKAEELKRDPGSQVGAVIEATSHLVDDLCQEIHLSFDLFENQYDRKVDNILLSGGGSLLSGLEANFERTFGIKLSRLDPLEALKTMPGVPTQDMRSKAAHLAIASGLAARLVKA